MTPEKFSIKKSMFLLNLTLDHYTLIKSFLIVSDNRADIYHYFRLYLIHFHICLLVAAVTLKRKNLLSVADQGNLPGPDSFQRRLIVVNTTSFFFSFFFCKAFLLPVSTNYIPNKAKHTPFFSQSSRGLV